MNPSKDLINKIYDTLQMFGINTIEAKRKALGELYVLAYRTEHDQDLALEGIVRISDKLIPDCKDGICKIEDEKTIASLFKIPDNSNFIYDGRTWRAKTKEDKEYEDSCFKENPDASFKI